MAKRRIVQSLIVPLLVAAGCVGSNSSDSPPDLSKYASLGASAVDPPPRGVLHITFDDGPSPAFTHDIVDIVTRHRAPSTFFVVGRNIPGHRELLEYERKAGHQVASHSLYHEPQPTLSETLFRQRLETVKDNIGDTDGGRLFFRFPYGAANREQLDWLARIPFQGKRYRPVGWNADSSDFNFGVNYPAFQMNDRILIFSRECGGAPNPFVDDFVGWTQFIARRTGGGILLFHDVQAITHDRLDDILTYFENPTAYWASVPAAKRATYEAYYACENADPQLAFRFESIHGGAFPSFRD